MARADPQVRFVPQTVVHVPFRTLENAFWRPQAAKLHGKHKDSLKDLADVRATKTWQKLWLAWAREETWINHAFNGLLLALPDEALSNALAAAAGGHRVSAPVVVKLESAGLAGLTGDPDFIVRGEDRCVLGENKVQAHPKSHRYSFEQYAKYMTLGAMVACAESNERREAMHLLVVPSDDLTRTCSDFEQWRPRVVSGRLVVDPAAIQVTHSKGHFRDFATWREHVLRRLSAPATQARWKVDVTMVEKLFSENGPALVPSYVVTWADLMASIEASATQLAHRSAM
jgi:hypothetical protein